MADLIAQLLGPPRLTWEGAAVEPPTRKALALVVWLAAEGRPVTRERASALLWGPGRTRNLRQELYVLRKLPGAEAWLIADERISVRCRTDLDSWVDGADPGPWRGELCEGLDGVREPGFEDWLDTARARVAQRWAALAVVWAHRCLDEGRLDAAWEGIEAGLELGSEPLLRVALETQLRRGDRVAAQQLWEVAQERCDVRAPEWAFLGAQLHQGADARMRALDEAARTVIRIGSLDPEPLPAPVLAAASELGPVALTSALQTLSAAGLWREGRPELEAGRAVREGLARQAREALHARLAELLRAEGAGPGRVAAHLEAAGQPAWEAWMAEARRTGRSEAIEGADRTARTPAERTEALVEGIVGARRRGDLDAARALWTRLDAHALRAQTPGALVAAALHDAVLCGMQGALDAAARAIGRAGALAGPEDPGVIAVRGALELFAGRPVEALPLLEAGRAAADPVIRRLALNGLGAVASLQGDAARADAIHTEILAEARRDGRLLVIGPLLNSLGANAIRRGDHRAGLEHLDQALRLANELDDRENRTPILFNLAHTRILLGELGPARALVRDLIDVARRPRERGLAFRARADLERATGRFEEAVMWSGRARKSFEDAGDVAQAAVSRFNEAQARYLLDRSPAGLEALRRATEEVASLGRADLAGVRAELALFDPTPTWEPAPEAERTDVQWAAALRVAGLAEREIPLPALPRATFVGAYVEALCAHAVQRRDPERAAQLRERVRERVRRGAEGLLEDQRSALEARLERWLVEPLVGL